MQTHTCWAREPRDSWRQLLRLLIARSGELS